MRTISIRLLISVLLTASLGLSACGTAKVQSDNAALSGIYTAVAITVQAQAAATRPTATLEPTSTLLPTSTAGASSTSSPTATVYLGSYTSGSICENSAYLSDVTIEDGTELAPGESFTKIWEFENTGSCAWSKTFSVEFVSGDDMDGSSTEIDTVVDPGEEAELSVPLTAPEDEGTYTGYWQLADTNGYPFGERVYVQIVVSDAAASSTPTSTPTTMVNTATPMTVVDTPTPTTVVETPTPTYDVDTETPTAIEDTATPTVTALVSSPTPMPNMATPTPTVDATHIDNGWAGTPTAVLISDPASRSMPKPT
jgi:hypothetical protein